MHLVISVMTLAVPTLVAEVEFTGFSENRWWPAKNGVAFIRDGIHVGARATNLVTIQDEPPKGERRWAGESVAEPEVVVVFERRALEWSALPRNFDSNWAIVVSFEPERVRVFDFAQARAGYYPRSSRPAASWPYESRLGLPLESLEHAAPPEWE